LKTSLNYVSVVAECGCDTVTPFQSTGPSHRPKTPHALHPPKTVEITLNHSQKYNRQTMTTMPSNHLYF
jgi:hypothetical protein